MLTTEQVLKRLMELPGVLTLAHAPLSAYTRFGLGGPADIYIETSLPESFIAALEVARSSGLPYVVIGGGTNLVVSDEGFRGVVLKLISNLIQISGTNVTADSGVVLQELVDASIAAGLKGIETMTGIPGSVGAAVYGNAGAYGHSISEFTQSVKFYDGQSILTYSREQCEFHYRESVFKRKKDWIILSAELVLTPADAAELAAVANGILAIRDEKYPRTMKCAGSIFKNFLVAELPPEVVAAIPPKVIREGKIPSAYFLERVDAKGMHVGDIHVATYHANLIFNAGNGTARDVCALILELKRRVRDRFGIKLEEEVQYVGFEQPALTR